MAPRTEQPRADEESAEEGTGSRVRETYSGTAKDCKFILKQPTTCRLTKCMGSFTAEMDPMHLIHVRSFATATRWLHACLKPHAGGHTSVLIQPIWCIVATLHCGRPPLGAGRCDAQLGQRNIGLVFVSDHEARYRDPWRCASGLTI